MNTQKSSEIKPTITENITKRSEYFDNKVLVHSTKPIRILPDNTLKEFEMHFDHGMNVEQKIAWSHVLSGDSLLICSTNGEDPTLYYLPVICGIIVKQILEWKEPSVGPVAIIVVPTKLHALHMRQLCAAFLGPKCLEKNGLVTTTGNMDNSKICNQLKKGCGILVTTFTHFELLLAQNVADNLIDKSRLKHVIIDDLDVLSKYNYSKLQEIMYILMKLCLTESYGQQIISPQFIIISQSYNQELMPFLIRRIRHPLIIFKDFIDATVYGGINFAIMTNSHYLGSKKDLLLLEVKKFKKLEQRTIIFCKNFYDVLEVQTLLTQNGIDFLFGINDNIELVNDWKSNLSRKILICTDNFYSLKIYNADNVIHYTYPDNWYSFKKRFSVLISNYRNMMNTDFYSVNDLKQSVVALINDNDTFNLHHLIELFITQKREINPELYHIAKSQLNRSRLECVRQSFYVCPDLAIFGSCKTVRCGYNHYMGPKDFLTEEQQKYLPMYGIVSIKILHIYTPTHFVVRLLTWKESMQDEFDNSPFSYNALLNKLQSIYKDLKSPEKYWPPKVGEICVAKVGSQYQRIRILMILNTNASANDRMVAGQSVDENMQVLEFKCSELLVCPPEIRVVPPKVMHLFLSAILPNASIPQDTEQFKSWLSLNNQWNGKIRFEAEILGALTHTIFASNVFGYKKKSCFSEEQRLDLNKILTNKGYGKYDSNNAYRIQQIFFLNQK